MQYKKSELQLKVQNDMRLALCGVILEFEKLISNKVQHCSH